MLLQRSLLLRNLISGCEMQCKTVSSVARSFSVAAFEGRLLPSIKRPFSTRPSTGKPKTPPGSLKVKAFQELGGGGPFSVESMFSEGQSKRRFADYSIYKGKAVLTMNPVEPVFTRLTSGDFKLSRAGCVFLSFSPAVALRQYDWSKKQIFALSVAEIGQLIALGLNDSCELFHDPFMKKSDAGKVRKVLKVVPLQGRGAYSFTLHVSDKIHNIEDSFFVPVERHEFAVMRSSFTFILPYLMGWHAFAGSRNAVESRRSLPGGPDTEWVK